MEESKEVK